MSFHTLDFVKLIPQLDDGEADHTRIEAEGSSDVMLNLGRRVEAHDEVMAIGVSGLVFRGWAR